MGELGAYVAYKTPGKIDFINGRMGYFVCYCPNCREKVILSRSQYNVIVQKLARPVHHSPREFAKRALLKMADKI